MRLYPRLKQYKCSNLIYDIEQQIAHSYGWYVIAKRFNGIMVVNDYNYSNTTLTHSYKLKRLFDEIDIDYVTIEAPRGLQDLDASINHYADLIFNLQQKINKPRSRKSTNDERHALINNCVNKYY